MKIRRKSRGMVTSPPSSSKRLLTPNFFFVVIFFAEALMTGEETSARTEAAETRVDLARVPLDFLSLAALMVLGSI